MPVQEVDEQVEEVKLEEVKMCPQSEIKPERSKWSEPPKPMTP